MVTSLIVGLLIVVVFSAFVMRRMKGTREYWVPAAFVFVIATIVLVGAMSDPGNSVADVVPGIVLVVYGLILFAIAHASRPAMAVKLPPATLVNDRRRPDGQSGSSARNAK